MLTGNGLRSTISDRLEVVEVNWIAEGALVSSYLQVSIPQASLVIGLANTSSADARRESDLPV